MSKLLWLILFSALALRLVGLDYGLPMFLVSDEVSLTAGALKMLELRTIIPSLYPDEFRLLYYPPLISYLYLFFIIPVLLFKLLFNVTSVTALKNAVTLDPTSIWLATRLATVLLGVMVVYLTYLIGKKLLSSSGGIVAAVLVAGSFLAVSLSHFARHWIPATFFFYLLSAFAVVIYKNPERKTYMWAGLLAGIAFGASYVTIFGIVVIVFAHLLFRKEPFIKRIFSKDLGYFFIIFFAVASIFILLNYPEFLRIVAGEDSTLFAPKTTFGLFVSIWESIAAFFQYDPILAIAGLLGLLVLMVENRRLLVLFLALPLTYWSVLYLFLHFEPRYNMLLVPWFSLLSAHFFLKIWRLPMGRIGKAIVVIIIISPLVISGYYDYLLIQPDSREQAREWIEQNISSGESIALYAKTLDLYPTPEAVQKMEQSDPELLRTRDRVIVKLEDEKLPQPAYNFQNIRSLLPEEQNQISLDINQQFRYLVVEYYPGEELPGFVHQSQMHLKKLAEFSSIPKRERLLDLNGNFNGNIMGIFGLKNLGPNIEIYEF